MRVISGKYKGKILQGFDIRGTRPTMDRVKESMIASIYSYLKDAVVLDLFAGSGSLGIEALSNGCKMCYFIDNNKIAIETIQKNIQNIDSAFILKEDCFAALQYFKNNQITFDAIFLDPPYHDNLLNNVIDKIYEYQLLNKEGILICEYEEGECKARFPLLKSKKYGLKKVDIYQNSEKI